MSLDCCGIRLYGSYINHWIYIFTVQWQAPQDNWWLCQQQVLFRNIFLNTSFSVRGCLKVSGILLLELPSQVLMLELVWFGLVWFGWHINLCRIFNLKFFSYIYLIYDFQTHFIDNIFKQSWAIFSLNFKQFSLVSVQVYFTHSSISSNSVYRKYTVFCLHIYSFV